jgi:hypothetical protein
MFPEIIIDKSESEYIRQRLESYIVTELIGM